MIMQQVRKVGNSMVVTLPKAEVERLGLKEGDFVALEVNAMELHPRMDPDLQSNADRNRKGLTQLMQYLKDR